MINSNLTIVIPLYNKEKYITRCLDSIVNQKMQPKKIIVVNDGSTDNGMELIKNKYKSVEIVNVENGGVSRARNLGFSLAMTRFVAFIDADDEYLESFLDTANRLIHDYPNEAMYGFGYQRFGESAIKSSVRGVADYFELYMHQNKSPHSASSVVLNKELLSNPIFPEDCGMGEDLYAWIRILDKGYRFIYDSKLVAIYHHDDINSAVLKPKAKEVPLFLKNTDMLLAMKNKYIDDFISYHQSDLIKSHLLYGNKAKVITFIIKTKNKKLYKYLLLVIVPQLLLLLFYKLTKIRS